MNKVTITRPEESNLSEVLDRLLDTGVVISGDIILSLAGIDLVYCSLRVLLTSVDKVERLAQETKKQDKISEE